MHPAPFPGSEIKHTEEDRLVADPLIYETDQLWKETARKNREIYTEIFRPLPTNFVQNVAAYDVCITLFKVLHLLDVFTNNHLSVLYSKRGEAWSCCSRDTIKSSQRSPEPSPRVSCRMSFG